MKTAIIFDLDGTLLNTLDDLTHTTNLMLTKHNYPKRTKEEIRNFVGDGMPKLVERALPNDVNCAEFEVCLQDFLEFYKENSNTYTKPYDGIINLLAELKRNKIPMGIVSNKLDFATKELAKEFFGDYIDVAIGHRDNCPKKPAPDSLFEAMQALGCKSCIYVGDSEVDIMTAKNAGVRCVLVLWGFRDRETLSCAGGECFVESALELQKTLTNNS